MADKKITALTALSAFPAVGDLLPIVDVSDTTDSASGTTKKITASQIGIPQIVYKSADETVNNSTTLQDDNHLFFPVGANEVWAFIAHIPVNSGANPDFKFTFTAPAGTTGGFANSETAGADMVAFGTTKNFSTNGVALGEIGALITGTAIVGGTAGNIQFQWAQNALEASDTKVLKGAYIIAHRLA